MAGARRGKFGNVPINHIDNYQEELAELESLLDVLIAEIRKDQGEREPSDLQGYQNLDDRAKLELWLDVLIAERKADKGEHERTMARVDRNLAAIKSHLEAFNSSPR